MEVARMSNVPIRDLIYVLTKLATRYEIIDIIINPEEKTIILDPVERVNDDIEITDENIYSLV